MQEQRVGAVDEVSPEAVARILAGTPSMNSTRSGTG